MLIQHIPYSGGIMEEAVEIILGKRICNALKDNKIFSIIDIKKYSDSELLKIRNIKSGDLLKIRALEDLISFSTYRGNGIVIHTIKDLINLSDDIITSSRELVRIVALDENNTIIHIEDLFKGTADSINFSAKILLSYLKEHHVPKFVVIRNHPREKQLIINDTDVSICNAIKSVSTSYKSTVMDVLLVNKYSYISLKQSGYL